MMFIITTESAKSFFEDMHNYFIKDKFFADNWQNTPLNWWFFTIIIVISMMIYLVYINKYMHQKKR